jgi:hypothetical protein
MVVPGCRTLIRELTDHEEGVGTAIERAGVKLHLALCGDCTRYVEQARAVRAALGTLASGAIAPQTRARLLERFRAWHASLPPGGPGR